MRNDDINIIIIYACIALTGVCVGIAHGWANGAALCFGMLAYAGLKNLHRR